MVDDLARRCVVVVGVCDYMCVCVCAVVCVSVRFGVDSRMGVTFCLSPDRIKSNRLAANLGALCAKVRSGTCSI